MNASQWLPYLISGVAAIGALYTAISNRRTSREDQDLKRFDTFTAKVLKDNEEVRERCESCETELDKLRASDAEKSRKIRDLERQVARLQEQR